MDLNTVRGLLTLLFLVAFIGIIVYAWSSRNKKRFDEAAKLPFKDSGK